MERVNFFKLLIVVFLLLGLITCKNSSANEFNDFVVNKYSRCHSNDVCIVDLKNLPFEWDKFYIFSENHFPEVLTKEEISSILGAKYNENIDPNDRLIVFIFEGKIVYKILVRYEKENFIDSYPLLVDFYLDKKTPLFFTNDDARFDVKKANGNYLLYWMPNK